MQRNDRVNGTHILSVTKIPCPTIQNSTSAVWDIVFECSHEAFEQFQQGQYCNLHVPQISVVAHPFTVNKVPGYTDRLRLLVRESGSFTMQLGKCFNDSIQRSTHAVGDDDMEFQSSPASSMPIINISGFYGMPCRKDLMHSHDHAIIMAGGIGITPYLSGLLELTSTNLSTSSPRSFLKTLELHWICRDLSLIRYIYDEYFSKILNCTSLAGGVTVRIVVHYTGTEANFCCKSMDTFDVLPRVPELLQYKDTTYPMEQSYFSFGTSPKTFHGKLTLAAFLGIFTLGLWLIWFFYAGAVQCQDEMWTRANSIFVVVILSIGLSVGLIHFANGNASRASKLTTIPSKICSYLTTANNTCNVASYVQHATGRPKFVDLLIPLQNTINAGVFVCGPAPMLKSVLDAVDCIPIRFQVHEEHFEQ